jgi:hypothetical protein
MPTLPQGVRCPAAAGVVPAGERAQCVTELRNTGNMVLSSIKVDGDFNNCPTAELKPGAAAYCTVSRASTQDEFDAGSLTLSVTQASAKWRSSLDLPADVAAAAKDSAVVLLNRSAALDVAVTGDRTYATTPGEKVPVAVRVTNIGTIRLGSLKVSAPGLQALSCGTATILEPNAFLSCTASLVVDQDGFDAGRQVATATASGTGDPSNLNAAASGSLEVLPTSKASLSPIFTTCTMPDRGGGSAVCTLSLRNTGTVRLLDLTMANSDCSIKVLAPGSSQDCTLTKVIPQAAFDAATDSNALPIIQAVVKGFQNNTARDWVEFSSSSMYPLKLAPAVDVSSTPMPNTVSKAGGRPSWVHG